VIKQNGWDYSYPIGPSVTRSVEQNRPLPGGQRLGIYELGREVVMFYAPSQDSNPKTRGLTLAASLQSNVLNVLKFGSSGRIRTYNPSVNSRTACSRLTLQTKGLRVYYAGFAGNWGDFGGTPETS
jgi:hypothetical protein